MDRGERFRSRAVPETAPRPSVAGAYGPMKRVALVNPNTDAAITARMLAVARAVAPPGVEFVGITAERGAALITDEAQLTAAADAVTALAPRLRAFNGIIVSAFGDPGCHNLRAACGVPVAGIGESALREAALRGRRFAVATTTPSLSASIERAVARLGFSASFAGVMLTSGDAAALTGRPELLLNELRRVLDQLAASADIEAVVIGGGPLADAARSLSLEQSVIVIEPVPAAVRAIAALFSHPLFGNEDIQA